MVDYDNVLVVYYDRVLVLCEQKLEADKYFLADDPYTPPKPCKLFKAFLFTLRYTNNIYTHS